jgi:hypothetical protein
VSGVMPGGALHPQPAAADGQPVQHLQAGLWWPAADAGELRSAAAAWLGLATEVGAVSETASTVIRGLTGQNQAQAIDALEAWWESRWMGVGGVLPAVEKGARALADGLDRYASAVEQARARIEELIAAAMTAAVIGIGLTILTVGISDVAAGAVAAGLIAAAAAVGVELSAEVAAILAGVAVVAGAGALEGGLSDLAIQEERIAYFHDQGSFNWNEALQYSAVGAATAGATFGAGTALQAAAPALGRILTRLSGRPLASVEGDSSAGEPGLHGVAGMRSPASRKLSDAEIQRIRSEFEQLGGNPNSLRFNEATQTGFSDASGRIYIRGDVLPASDPSAIHPRSIMSSRAVLAHELGHAHFRGTALRPGAWNDEFRASYWAARNVPGLSPAERMDLIRDALMRAREANVPVTSNKYILEMLYGIGSGA